jgi:serine/threonine protein kinase
MGEVHQAYDQRLDRHVAIKFIPPEDAGDEVVRERFRREARAAAGLSHPSIVQVFDVLPGTAARRSSWSWSRGRPWGRSSPRAPLDLRTALRLGREIAEGLAAAHARGILHRDLKPENVLVSPEGHAKILDFGLAKSLEAGPEPALTRERTVVGTCRSMSPEQARGLPLDARSDLFSLGGLLYEMLAGRAPFEGATAMDTLANICAAGQVPVRDLAPGVPEIVSDLVDQLLEKDPCRRPASAREAAARLESASAWMPTPLPDDDRTRVDAPPIRVPAAAGPPATLSGSRGYSTSRSLRRVLLATAVLLLAAGGLLDRVYLWKESPRTVEVESSPIPPDYEMDARPLFQPYLKGTRQKLEEISRPAFELIVMSWLRDLIRQLPETLLLEPLEDAGLTELARDGRIIYPAAA